MAGPNQPYTNLDANQVLKQSFDEAEDRLRVDAQVSATISSIEIDAADSSIKIADADGDILEINPDGSINVEIQGTIDVSISDLNDSIKIGDGSGDYLQINSDGSINVNAVLGTGSGTVVNTFNAISSVPSAIETTITTYTVPLLKISKLVRVEFSGENIATFNVYKNGTMISRQRTYFGSNLSGNMDFSLSNLYGLEFIAGDVIALKVLHNRPNVGDFDGRILTVEI